MWLKLQQKVSLRKRPKSLPEDRKVPGSKLDPVKPALAEVGMPIRNLLARVSMKSIKHK